MNTPAFDRISGLLDPGRSADDGAAPPNDLWNRIEAETKIEVVGAGTVVEYSIGPDDTLVATGADWKSFALDNGAPEMVSPDPERTLWSFIEDDNARDVWRLVVSQVRATGEAATVPFRCDSPGMRRWFEMTVSDGGNGRVDFRSVLLFEESRPTVVLMDGTATHDDSAEHVRVCGFCARGHDGSGWISVDELVYRNRMLEEPPTPAVDHVICETCVGRVSGEADRLEASGGES